MRTLAAVAAGFIGSLALGLPVVVVTAHFSTPAPAASAAEITAEIAIDVAGSFNPDAVLDKSQVLVLDTTDTTILDMPVLSTTDRGDAR